MVSTTARSQFDITSTESSRTSCTHTRGDRLILFHTEVRLSQDAGGRPAGDRGQYEAASNTSRSVRSASLPMIGSNAPPAPGWRRRVDSNALSNVNCSRLWGV